MQNKVFWPRITSLYGCQTSPVVLCMLNSVISTRITSLYWSQPSSVVWQGKQRLLDQNYKSLWVLDLSFRFVHAKTAWLASEILVSMFSSPHLWFCAFKTATLEPKLHISKGPRLHLWFLHAKQSPTIRITSSYGSSPHLWFLHATQRLLDQKNKSLWVPDMICRFVHAKQRD